MGVPEVRSGFQDTHRNLSGEDQACREQGRDSEAPAAVMAQMRTGMAVRAAARAPCHLPSQSQCGPHGLSHGPPPLQPRLLAGLLDGHHGHGC